MIDLQDRLAELAEELDIGGGVDFAEAFAGAVLVRVPDAPPRRRRRLGLAAAAVLLVVAASLAAIPSSRRTIADWFGLDRVQIERQPDLSVPARPDPVGTPAGAPSSTIVGIDGADIVVTTIDGRLVDAFISKTVGGDTSVERVDVGGRPGVWIAGEPHELAIEVDGVATVTRFAGNTLLWQDGDVLLRVEGFDSRAAALAYALAL